MCGFARVCCCNDPTDRLAACCSRPRSRLVCCAAQRRFRPVRQEKKKKKLLNPGSASLFPPTAANAVTSGPPRPAAARLRVSAVNLGSELRLNTDLFSNDYISPISKRQSLKATNGRRLSAGPRKQILGPESESPICAPSETTGQKC